MARKQRDALSRYFKTDTLAIFENDMERLTEVTGIAHKKLCMIDRGMDASIER